MLPRAKVHTLLQCNPTSPPGPHFRAWHIVSGECDPHLQAGSQANRTQAAAISKAVRAISRVMGKAVPEDSNNISSSSMEALLRRTRSTSHSPAMEPRRQVHISAAVPLYCRSPCRCQYAQLAAPCANKGLVPRLLANL